MKKIFSLLMAFVFGATLVSAKTIYCKMAQDWWKVDGAAVGCHSWGTPGPGTDWPGVRMTPVEGETDLWSIELDTDKVQNVIFTRVNASGAIADWGAKTKDLQIPTDDKNLFTITTSSESWGDPGCDGEWSVYGDTPEPTEYYLIGYINGADYGCEADIDNMGDYNLTAGPVVITFTEKSYVQVKNQNKSIYGTAYVDATEPGSTVLSVGATDKIGLPANVEITFTLTENADGTVTLAYTWGDTPTPGTSTYYLVGYINGVSSGCDEDYENFHEEYKFVDGSLTTTFTETSYVFVKTGDNEHWYLPDSYILPDAKVEVILAEGNAEKVGVNGNVEVTFTLTENADGTVTLSYQEASTPAEEGFGIILGDGSTIKGQKNEGQVEFEEYVTVANLTAGAIFQLYDFANEVAWTVDNIDEASTPNLTINEDYVYEVTADGKYTIYLKMYGMGNDQVYCGYEEPVSGLNNVKAIEGQRFNVLGLPVDANYRGVVIMNGQTYLQ